MSLQNPTEQPVAATVPKLMPPMMMPRAFLPYVGGVPPQFSPLPPTDRLKSAKDSIGPQDKHQFPLMYGLPTPPHLKREDVGKEDDFFQCNSKCFIV